MGERNPATTLLSSDVTLRPLTPEAEPSVGPAIEALSDVMGERTPAAGSLTDVKPSPATAQLGTSPAGGDRGDMGDCIGGGTTTLGAGCDTNRKINVSSA